MFSEAIKQKVQTRAHEMAASHAAVVQAKEGRVSSQSLANYLVSLHFLLSQTVPHLQRARERALGLGQVDLALFFDRKLSEEAGHDKWAEDDIREITRHNGGSVVGRPLPTMIELVQYLTELTESDPRLYVVYILSNEYFTVLAGPVWVEALVEHCGVPLRALSSVTKHVAADREHAAHGFSELDRLITDAGLAHAVLGTVDQTMRLFDQFFQEVVTKPD